MIKSFKKLGFSLLFCLPLFAFAAENFVAGKDYEVIGKENKSANKISVIEFFSYNCPWCARIEPAIEAWAQKQGSHIEFTRIPVIFHKDWLLSAKAYYTANLLNMENKLNPLLFKAEQDKANPLKTEEDMIQFFIKQGVEPATARSAFESSTMMDLKIKEGMSQMSHYRVNGVPAFIINNQFKTDVQMAGSEERLIQILNYLLSQAHMKKAA